MKKILLTTLISGLALSGCGGSSSSSDSSKKSDTSVSILGNWNASVTCQYDDENLIFFQESLAITTDSISVKRINHSQDDTECSGVGTEDNKTYKYSKGELVNASNSTEIKMQQIDAIGAGKVALYVSPGSKHLVFTDGVNDSTDYPTDFSIDDHFIKEGANLKPSGATVTVLDHSGINLTTGVSNNLSEDQHDLATIAWSPTGVGPAGFDENGSANSGWGEGVWIRPNHTTKVNADDPEDTNIYISDMGKTDFSKVTNIPTSWPQNWVTPLTPIQEGHTYVVRLMNGKHAKLRVLHEPDFESEWWPVLIEYQLMD